MLQILTPTVLLTQHLAINNKKQIVCLDFFTMKAAFQKLNKANRKELQNVHQAWRT